MLLYITLIFFYFTTLLTFRYFTLMPLNGPGLVSLAQFLCPFFNWDFPTIHDSDDFVNPKGER